MAARHHFEIVVGERPVSLGERTLIMGVLNVTPDSFSDGARYFDPIRAVEHGVALARAGADWIDVGGESTRPGAKPVTLDEELRRVLPVICNLRRKLRNVPISIDTTKASVAQQALEAGANMLNDVSGLRFDPQIAEAARRHRVPLVLMHLRGTPETMQKKPFAQDIWRSLFTGFETSIRRALAAGVKRNNLILDPGLGFGKSRRQNYEILAGLAKLQRFHLPLLIGASRKSFVQAIVNGQGLDPAQVGSGGSGDRTVGTEQVGLLHQSLGTRGPSALPVSTGDAALVVAAILNGAHVVRVHDPAAILPAVRVADALLSTKT